MPKYPPERYDPGELGRTRQNLGDLTEDEARKMAEIFGGEVGMERTPPELEEKYRRLKMLNRRNSDPRIIHGSREAYQEESLKQTPEIDLQRRHPGYLDRVRINFWASSTDYALIPRHQALGSLFSFIIPIHEQLHPRFIIKADQVFYNSLERFVLAVRSLMSINRREEVPSLLDHRCLQILTILKGWNIETIHQELTVLQRSPRNQPVSSAGKLIRAFYRPFVKLVNLEPETHILPAIKRLFDLDLMAYPPDSGEADRIKRIGSTLKQEIFHLFTDVRRRCAPLLVKLADLPYAPYPELFSYFRPQILEYLSLTRNDILESLPEDLLAGEAESDFLPEEEETVEAAEEEILEEPEEEEKEAELPEEASKALEFLSRLFPQSGFEEPWEFPDMFRYFKPILSFPKNADLFHPENPLHQLAVLLAVLQEFLYGFRQIIFGEVIDEEDNATEIQSEIDKHISGWNRLLDELLCGRLLNELVDYCRQIERSPEYRHSESGIKQESFIMLRIRRSLLPHLQVSSRGSIYPEERSLPQLHTSVSGFYSLLSGSLQPNPESYKPGIRNANAPFHFEIDSFVIQRFRRYLKRKGLPQDNRNLVSHSALILGYLDYLVNNPESHLYRSGQFPLYRHEEGHREIPIYSVTSMETARIIESNDIELTPPEEFLEGEKENTDRVSGLLDPKEYATTVQSAVENYHSAGLPLSIITISIPELRILEPEERDDRLRVIGHCIRGEIREYSDRPFRMPDDTIPIVLQETNGDNARLFCRRLSSTIMEKLPGLGIHIGLVSYHPTWSANKMVKLAARTTAEAERHRSPALVSYHETDDSFEEQLLLQP
ncbi:hypothetical protein [Marispirochaeta aestuarii]|uniref:hypothetical protein n=1 Tax=Marispirochaeta aestuarii TaxID=1963862 RepID=UPI002ABD482D|nr:hypothetical protein [Marispirochaeta aestuarii]